MRLDLKTWLIWTLRKASYRWPPRQEALRRSAVSKAEYLKNPGEAVTNRIKKFYRCAKCLKVFSRKGVSIDHVEPVVDPRRGWQGFDVYITRMFCATWKGFQILCGKDHDAKTQRENEVRKKYRKVRKAA